MAFKQRKVSLLVLIVYGVLAVVYVDRAGSPGAQDWRTASREPAGIAPDPATTPEAVIQVYAARTVSWRGYFGVHTWIAVKRSEAERFDVHEVIGYRLRRTGSAVVSHQRAPDGYWFGNRPELLRDLRGDGVDELIDRIEQAVQRYPYASTYRIWPGPNSNTFTAFVAREVPELRVDLPPTAIGKDYLELPLVGMTPSGTGAQFSLFGVAGVLAGVEEGLEINLLGLTLGIDPRSLSLKLPLIGRLGACRTCDMARRAPRRSWQKSRLLPAAMGPLSEKGPQAAFSNGPRPAVKTERPAVAATAAPQPVVE